MKCINIAKKAKNKKTGIMGPGQKIPRFWRKKHGKKELV